MKGRAIFSILIVSILNEATANLAGCPTHAPPVLSLTTHEGAPSFAAKLVLSFLASQQRVGLQLPFNAQETALISRSW